MRFEQQLERTVFYARIRAGRMVQIKKKYLEQWQQYRKESSSVWLEWNELEKGRVMENVIREKASPSSC